MKFLVSLIFLLSSHSLLAKSPKAIKGKKVELTITGELHKHAIMSGIWSGDINDKDSLALHFNSESKNAVEIFKTCKTNGDICEVSGSGFETPSTMPEYPKRHISFNKIKSVKLIKKADSSK